jgi:hypothetical protein
LIDLWIAELADLWVANLAPKTLSGESYPLHEWGAKEPLRYELPSQWPAPHARDRSRSSVERQETANAAQPLTDLRIAELADLRVANLAPKAA